MIEPISKLKVTNICTYIYYHTDRETDKTRLHTHAAWPTHLLSHSQSVRTHILVLQYISENHYALMRHISYHVQSSRSLSSCSLFCAVPAGLWTT